MSNANFHDVPATANAAYARNERLPPPKNFAVSRNPRYAQVFDRGTLSFAFQYAPFQRGIPRD